MSYRPSTLNRHRGEFPTRSKAKGGIIAEKKALDAWLAKHDPLPSLYLTSKNKAKRLAIQKANTPK